MSSQLLIVAFPSRAALNRALNRLMTSEYLDIQRAAIVAKADTGETIVLDDDVSPDQGGIAGGTLGATLSILGLAQLGALALPGVGPIIALGTGALVGALVGRVTGRFAAQVVELGFKREHVEQLAERLKTGQPALILEIRGDTDITKQLMADLEQFSAELLEPAMTVYHPPAQFG